MRHGARAGRMPRTRDTPSGRVGIPPGCLLVLWHRSLLENATLRAHRGRSRRRSSDAGWRCMPWITASAAADLLPVPPLVRRIARPIRRPGLRASPPSSPGPRCARLRLAGGPWTPDLALALHASRRLRKQMFNHRGTCRRKAKPCTRTRLPAPPRAMRAARIVRATCAPRAFPPYPPRTHPKQVGVLPNPRAPLRGGGAAWTCGRT